MIIRYLDKTSPPVHSHSHFIPSVNTETYRSNSLDPAGAQEACQKIPAVPLPAIPWRDGYYQLRDPGGYEPVAWIRDR